MATEQTFNYNDPNKKDKEETNTSGATPSTSSVAGGVQPVSQVQAPRSTGRFTNIQSYLQANQGGGQALGQKVASNIQKQAGQAQGQVSAAASNVANQIQSEKNRLAQASQVQQQIKDDPTQVNMDVASRLRSGQVQAPNTQGLQNVAAAQQNRLQDISNMARSESGRSQLLNQVVSRPSYTQGQGQLDSMLFNTQADTRKLGQIGQRGLEQTRRTFSDTLRQAGAATPELQQQAQLAAQNINNELNTQRTAFDQMAQDKARQEFEFRNQLRQYLKGGDFARQLAGESPAGEVGIQPVGPTGQLYDEGRRILLGAMPQLKDQALYNMSSAQLSNLLAQSFKDQGDPTAEQVISEQDLARINALNKLAEVNDSRYAKDRIIDPTSTRGSFDSQFIADQFAKQRQAQMDALYPKRSDWGGRGDPWGPNPAARVEYMTAVDNYIRPQRIPFDTPAYWAAKKQFDESEAGRNLINRLIGANKKLKV